MLLAAACTIGAALSGLPACCMGLVGIDACRREFGYECSDVSEDAHIVKRLARQYDPTAQDYISDFRGPISLARMQLLLPHSGSGSGSAQKSQLETRDSSHMRMRKGPQGQGRRVAGVWELAMRRMRAKQALRARKRARREQREREKVADSAAAALLRERANRRRHSRL
jgi:hypothetical protein